MSKLLRVSFAIIFLIILTSCSALPNNTIRYLELTDDELYYTNALADSFTAFEYRMNEDVKEAHIWGERYINGKKEKEPFIEFWTSPSENRGVVTTSFTQFDDEEFIVRTASIDGASTRAQEKFKLPEGTASLYGPNMEQNIRIDGEIVLTISAYQFSEDNQSFRTPDFEWFKNPSKHVKELQEYDQIDVIKIEFSSKEKPIHN